MMHGPINIRFTNAKQANVIHEYQTATTQDHRGHNKTTDVVIHQHSRRLLNMDILMSETC